MSTMWIPDNDSDYDQVKGYDVYSSDNEKVGTVQEVLHPGDETAESTGGHYFKVEPGLLKELRGADEMYVPEDAVSAINVGQKRVILAVSKDLVKQQAWGKPRHDIAMYRRV